MKYVEILLLFLNETHLFIRICKNRFLFKKLLRVAVKAIAKRKVLFLKKLVQEWWSDKSESTISEYCQGTNGEGKVLMSDYTLIFV